MGLHLGRRGSQVPPGAEATAMLWRAQRLELPDPLHRSLVAPFLPTGAGEAPGEAPGEDATEDAMDQPGS